MRSVLRGVLLVLACGLLGVGLVLMRRGPPWPGLPATIWGAVLVAALLCERWRYRHIAHPPAGNWHRTGERFEDPETGQVVEVLYDPRSGERRYAPVSGPAATRK